MQGVAFNAKEKKMNKMYVGWSKQESWLGTGAPRVAWNKFPIDII